MNIDDKIYVAGHKGMVGSSLFRKLKEQGYKKIIGESSSKLDLRNQLQTEEFFKYQKPDYIFLAAGKVGGIVANDNLRADFIYDNLMIQSNVIHAAYKHNVKKLLFLGSSCIYPKYAEQPIKEDSLLSGKLEPTNEPYAIAKIAGIKLCEAYRDQHGANFISVMPTNLYGPNDNYDLNNSHVLPALLRKFHEAKVSGSSFVEVWGTGTPKREFLHVDDLADASIFLMQNYNQKEIVNIGTGTDISIKDLADLIAQIVEFKGEIIFNTEKPDGTPKKQLNVSKLHQLGWKYKIELEQGVRSVYKELVTEKVI